MQKSINVIVVVIELFLHCKLFDYNGVSFYQ